MYYNSIWLFPGCIPCSKSQGAFHVVDLWREIELLLGVAAYSLLPLRDGATIFYSVNVGVTALFTIITNDFILVY